MRVLTRSQHPRRLRAQSARRRVLSDLYDAKRTASQEEVLSIADDIWRELNTPKSLGLHLLLKNGQVADILKESFDPSRYIETDWKTARDDYQAVSFLRKCPLEIAGIDRKEAAWKKFLEAEQRCRTTNARFRNLRLEELNPSSAAILVEAQRKIAEWLGPRVPASSWALRCRFGPGADTLNKGRSCSAYHKLRNPSVTKTFYEGAQALVRDHPVWSRTVAGLGPEDEGPHGFVRFQEVTGNQIVFVPKTALIERSIAIEPGMNIFAQLGLGALIRSRLKRVGLDLDEQDPNRALAYVGSRDGTVATIDLASASDTLAREVVRFLLPDHWYFCMNICRSHCGTVTRSGKKELVQYEKFSSMGNGFTFELESLIFFALAYATCEYEGNNLELVRSFGDDITCPTSSVSKLEEMIQLCGFEVNISKSYTTGIFRESCGMDLFAGVNIRPFFLKESSLVSASSLVRLANGIRRVAYRRDRYFGLNDEFRAIWVSVIQRIPKSLRNVIVPPLFQEWTDLRLEHFKEIEDRDDGIIDELDRAMVSPYVRRNPDGWDGWTYAGMVTQGAVMNNGLDWASYYAFGLYSCKDGSSEEPTLGVPLRGVSRRRLKRDMFTPSWPTLKF